MSISFNIYIINLFQSSEDYWLNEKVEGVQDTVMQPENQTLPFGAILLLCETKAHFEHEDHHELPIVKVAGLKSHYNPIPCAVGLPIFESGSYWLDKVRTSIWRDVRTLAIEEAYTTKYSIHPGADTMLCGFRLTNRWLSMKKDIASCGSKYLAYLEVEVEYQGSSGLLLQPELPE
ncbi:hypothetical protein Tco_1318170 [Tanacetum coccineum]